MIQEKKLNTEYNFIFNTFSNDDIELIIQDLQRFKENHYLLYVVDTYDIVENYLPYTEMELFSRKNRNHQAQKFICYDHFFGRLNTTSTILLNEYKVELLAAKNKLTRHLGEAKYVIKNLETLKKETGDFVNDPEKTEDFFKNHSVMIVAHRLSTVKNADQIVVLNKGKITERGTHQELINLKGEYFTLVKNQLEVGD